MARIEIAPCTPLTHPLEVINRNSASTLSHTVCFPAGTKKQINSVSIKYIWIKGFLRVSTYRCRYIYPIIQQNSFLTHILFLCFQYGIILTIYRKNMETKAETKRYQFVSICFRRSRCYSCAGNIFNLCHGRK